MDAYRAAGVEMYAISYDEPDALADYASAHDTTYTLLSDPDSEVIRDFGILNTSIPEDEHPWYGIPFPGAYVIDGDGTIVAKFFEHNFAVRPGPEQMLAAALGEQFDLPEAAAAPEEVTVEVALEAESLATGVTRDLVARFQVPPGQHLYSEPVPEGLVAASIEIDEGNGIIAYTPSTPATRPLTLSGSGDTLQVYEGNVVLRLPIAHNSRNVEKQDDGRRTVTVSGRVRWQSCDDEACGLPQTQEFSLDIDATHTVLADMGPGEGRVPAMNGATHFQKMIDRRK